MASGPLDSRVPASVALAQETVAGGGSARVEPTAAPSSGFDAAAAIVLIENALADRDAQISELQQAVVELANAAEQREAGARESSHPAEELVAALQAQLGQATEHAVQLEARLGEQERTLRHVLTMLIEWIESGEGQRSAA